VGSLIILDFDGVILESVSVKTDAFRRLFSFSPDHVDEIVQFHIDNGGMSRYDKFRHIYAKILREDLPQEKFEALSDRFSELVEEAVARAPFVDGAPEFLDYASERFPLYIVSATPEDELKRIVARKGIDRFFTTICGSPAKKKEHIERILKEKRLDCQEVLFVGDAPNDWEAARQCGIRFIGRIKPGDPDRFARLPDVEKKIADLRDLKTYLETLPC
jgi:HAD superfamily hydrolase (TIGR01549 family)